MTGTTNALPPSTTLSHRLFMLMFLISLLAFNTRAFAEPPTRQYSIPAGSLAHALNNLAEHSDLQVIYDTGLTQGLSSQGLKGSYSTAAALQKLLSGTGLVYTLSDGEVTIRAADKTPKPFVPVANPSPGKPEPMSESTLPKVTVEADSAYDPEYYADPYNKDYVIPNATAGTKTDTPIMETPLNIQPISKQVLKDQQVIRLDQAVKNVSGVTTNQGSFANSFFLRGFESQTLLRNGFRMDSNGWDDSQQFANVERIEVLKGSAATLYGRVEPGGMVNIITKQPLAKAYYSLNQQFGSYDLYRTSIDATGPLTQDDTLLYRVNASFQSNNSFRDLVSGENVFFAPVIKWNISPKTQATLEIEYQRDVSNWDVAILPFNLTSKRVIDNISHRLNFGEKNPQVTENIFVGFNWSHQFNDDWSLKHQVSYKSNEVNLGYSMYPYIINNKSVDRIAFRGRFPDETVATNLDLTGHFTTWGMKHTLLLGGDYYRFESFDGASNSLPDLSSINFDNPVHPSPGPALAENNNPTGQIVDNYGIYLQDQIKLPYNFEVMGGFRYQYVHSTNDAGFGPGGGISVLATDEAATPRVGLSWQPQSWLSLYGNYTENFGAQLGERQFKVGSPAGVPVPPQSAQQWEFGAKAEFFDGRLRTTFAYYDLTKQNVATTDTGHLFDCNQGPCSIAAGEVNSNGPEFDIQGEILPGWNVIATYANQDVRITKSNDTINTNNAFLKGHRLQFVPRNVGSFWTTYEAQQGLLKGFKIGGGVNLQDSAVDATNTIKSPGFALVGLMVGYSLDVGKTKITAQFNVDNLLDKSYYKNASASFEDASVSPVGTAQVNFSTPRTFLGSINVQY